MKTCTKLTLQKRKPVLRHWSKANGEEVVIIEESGLAVKLVLVADIPSSSGSNQGKLFNPEGLWEQAQPITFQDIAEVRKEMWHKFEQKENCHDR